MYMMEVVLGQVQAGFLILQQMDHQQAAGGVNKEPLQNSWNIKHLLLEQYNGKGLLALHKTDARSWNVSAWSTKKIHQRIYRRNTL